MKILKIFLIILFITSYSFSQSQDQRQILNLKSELNLKTDSPVMEKWSNRKITGLVYSLIIPGSGQFFLGHKTKGALMTLGFAGSLITTIVSASNFTGNQERLDDLKIQYFAADKYSAADEYWKTINEVYDEQKANQTRRDIFLYATIGIWALNILDYIFLTDDFGIDAFSQNLNFNNNLNYTLINLSIPLN